MKCITYWRKYCKSP